MREARLIILSAAIAAIIAAGMLAAAPKSAAASWWGCVNDTARQYYFDYPNRSAIWRYNKATMDCLVGS